MERNDVTKNLETTSLVNLLKYLNNIDMERNKLDMEEKVIIGEINRRFPNMFTKETENEVQKNKNMHL